MNETNTADPAHADLKKPSEILPAAAFPPMLAPTYTATKGADLTWVPMMFSHSLELSYSRTDYGTGYYIYHMLQPDLPTSRPTVAWTPETPIDSDAVATVSKAGSDLVAAEQCNVTTAETPLVPGKHALFTVRASEQATSDVARVHAVRFLKFTTVASAAEDLGNARLQISFDGREPSVDAPLAMMHGAGVLHEPNTSKTQPMAYFVKAYPVYVKFANDPGSGIRQVRQPSVWTLRAAHILAQPICTLSPNLDRTL